MLALRVDPWRRPSIAINPEVLDVHLVFG